MKVALITGITGQDGSYLAEFLLDKGYKVVGLLRRNSSAYMGRIEHIKEKLILESGDLQDQNSIDNAIKSHMPDEVYNLAAQSFVPVSWKQPEYTADVTGVGALRILDAIRMIKPDTKFYQASTSEMFGKVRETPQKETTPFYPRSPYGVAKVYAHWITVNYRESYNMFTCSGILFNHESPRRGLEFVTKKITDGVARIYVGKQNKLYLGNLQSKRDWGFAGDYVKAMWMMLQQDKPDDYVIGSEETHTGEEFCKLAFEYVGFDYKNHVEIDPAFYRPAEVDLLLSDSTKAKAVLGWKPEVNFKDLVYMMVDEDLRRVYNEQ